MEETTALCTGQLLIWLMSVTLLSVFSVGNDSVGMERLQVGMQGLGGLGTISHKEYLREQQFF